MPAESGHKWFAAFWDWMVRSENTAVKSARQEVAGGARGRVVEVGCGNGANFPYYGDAVTELIATDPDPYMLKRAEKRAAQIERPIAVRQAPAEELPFPDASFDTAVVTLVLCTVGDPVKALAEIKRVLKPGGEMRFLEHVRFRNPIGGFCQDAITPIWSWMGGGCHPNRDTERSMREAGFTIREIKTPVLEPPIPPMVCSRPVIQGAAVSA